MAAFKSSCGKYETNVLEEIEDHRKSCLECVAIRLKSSTPTAVKSQELVQIIFSAINSNGQAVEKREYLWEMSQLGQMVQIADTMSNTNKSAVRLSIDIALPPMR